MRIRAEELGLDLISSADELLQRHAEDDATMDTLRDLGQQEVARDTPEGQPPGLRWTGQRRVVGAGAQGSGAGAPTADSATAPVREAPTWITVCDDPRVLPGGPLTGFEVGVKDLLAVEGCALTAGTRAHRAAPSSADASAVRALREAGATIRGTTNLHALAYGATGSSSDWGRPPNPAVPGALPGGSSSGSAAAVADGSAELTLGTDTSGSIRIPAALCGVVGLKPTRGLISLEGCHPLSPDLDHVGPLGSSVTVVAAAMDALAGWPAAPLPREPLDTIRVGVLSGYFEEGMSRTVRHVLGQVRSAMDRDERVDTDAVDLSLARHIPGAQLAILGSQALTSNLETLRTRGTELPPDVRLRLEAGLARTDAQVAAALALRPRWVAEVDAALRRFHVLLCPTTSITAPAPGVATEQVDGHDVTVQFSLTRMTMPFNVSGHPAITLPVRDPHGIPVGIQLVGRLGADRELLEVAAYLEVLLG